MMMAGCCWRVLEEVEEVEEVVLVQREGAINGWWMISVVRDQSG